MTKYKGIEKVIVFGQSEIVNKQMPLFTIQQRYKYYFRVAFSCTCAFFFLVRIYPSALLTECAFFSCAYMRFFQVRFFYGHRKNTFLVGNTEYDILLNNCANERNIEMQEVIIRVFTWTAYVLETFIEKVIDIL